MPSLKEPEIDVAFVIAVLSWVNGEAYKATIALDTFCGLAYAGLRVLVQCCSSPQEINWPLCTRLKHQGIWLIALP